MRSVLAGVPRFDNAKQTVRLPVALLNTGSRKWKAPARLYGWNDSLVVVAPAGIANTSKTYISFADPDSAVAADAVDRAGAVLWRFDQHLAPEGRPQVLAGGATSGARWVELRVHPGVERFELVLHAEAKRAAPPVPAIPPNMVPEKIFDSTNIVTDSERTNKHFLRDIVVVIFQPGASQEQKEEAIGLVDGEVIAGIHHISKYEDLSFYEYIIRIPSDETEPPLWSAKDLFRTLPQVFGASSFYLHVSVPLYSRPSDGAGWEKTDWQVRPEQAGGSNWASEAVAAPLAWGCETVGYEHFPRHAPRSSRIPRGRNRGRIRAPATSLSSRHTPSGISGAAKLPPRSPVPFSTLTTGKR